MTTELFNKIIEDMTGEEMRFEKEDILSFQKRGNQIAVTTERSMIGDYPNGCLYDANGNWIDWLWL